jgi:hypothetical protein
VFFRLYKYTECSYWQQFQAISKIFYQNLIKLPTFAVRILVAVGLKPAKNKGVLKK